MSSKSKAEHLLDFEVGPPQGPSLVAQTVKRLPAMRETRVRFLGQEDTLEKEMAIHSSTLAWKIPWTEEPDRLQSMGLQRVRHNWATSLSLFTFMLMVVESFFYFFFFFFTKSCFKDSFKMESECKSTYELVWLSSHPKVLQFFSFAFMAVSSVLDLIAVFCFSDLPQSCKTFFFFSFRKILSVYIVIT